jgi:hypothetical protein
VLLGLAAVVTAVAYYLSTLEKRSPTPTVRAPAQSGLAVVCAANEPDGCQREAADLARRTPLTGEQRIQGEATAAQVGTVITRATYQVAQPTAAICPTAGQPCHIPEPTLQPGDADRVRTALVDAGFAGSVVRIAGPTDPAPTGSLLYAVPAGVGCVVGYQKGFGGGHGVVGHLPDGTCL